MSRRRRTTVGLLVATAAAGTLAQGQASPQAPAPAPAAPDTPRPARDLRYVILHRPGPAWVAGRSPFEQPGLQQHIDHYRQLQRQGQLLLGGPFMDPAAGGMMIPEPGLSEAELRAFALADPAVRSGLLLVELRPWLIGMRK